MSQNAPAIRDARWASLYYVEMFKNFPEIFWKIFQNILKIFLETFNFRYEVTFNHSKITIKVIEFSRR